MKPSPALPHPALEALEQRIKRIFIRHPAVSHATSVLDHALDARAGPRESHLGYIKGWSRCGKTETVKRFVFNRTGVAISEGIQFAQGKGRRVLYVEIRSGTTVKGFAQNLLLYFSDLASVTIDGNIRGKATREQDAVLRAIEVLAERGVELLVLDEFQNFFRTGGRADALAAASLLITIQNARRFAVVSTGTVLLDAMFDADDAIQQRKNGGVALLMPFAAKSAKERADQGRFIADFEAELPFLNKPGLASTTGLLTRTHYACGGRPGVLSELYEQAVRAACGRAGVPESGPVDLTLADVADGFDFLFRGDIRMRGINPYRGGKLPDFPLSIDDVVVARKPRGRGRGAALAAA